MRDLKALTLLFCLQTPVANALEKSSSADEVIEAVAKTRDGKVAYIEKHNIRHNAVGSPESALTTYYGPEKTVRATLATDFKAGLSASDYVFTDERDGSSHGVTVSPEGYLVWKKSKQQEREERLFKSADFKKKELVVAGQGLFFYLRSHLNEFSKGKSVPVKLLIPGRLDYFSFDLRVEEEDAKSILFKMKINSLFLRLFVSSLQFRFDKVTRQIIHYVGPSNLVDQSGGLQTVEITYRTGELE